MPLDRVIEVGLQTLAGLAAAHERGFIHRDIKPDNLMVDAEVADTLVAVTWTNEPAG